MKSILRWAVLVVTTGSMLGCFAEVGHRRGPGVTYVEVGPRHEYREHHRHDRDDHDRH